VSNYCAACLKCIEAIATVKPHVNQVQLHAGMRGADPGGLISYTQHPHKQATSHRRRRWLSLH